MTARTLTLLIAHVAAAAAAAAAVDPGCCKLPTPPQPPPAVLCRWMLCKLFLNNGWACAMVSYLWKYMSMEFLLHFLQNVSHAAWIHLERGSSRVESTHTSVIEFLDLVLKVFSISNPIIGIIFGWLFFPKGELMYCAQ